MTPTRMTVKSGDRANCIQAAIASVLDLPIDEVADFTDPAFENNWLDALTEWTFTQGLTYEITDRAPLGYCIAIGSVARSSWPHAVVARSGELFFDPAESDEFLDEVWGYIVFRPLYRQAA